MLLTTQNLRTYSSVGNYQTSSIAIMANNKQKNFHIKKEIWAIGIAAGVISFVSIVVAASVLAHEFSSGHEKPVSTYRNDDNSYAKHDFSKFDNN